MFGKICISTGYMIIVPGKSLGRYPWKWLLVGPLRSSLQFYKEEICWQGRDSNPRSSDPYRSRWYFIWKTNIGGNVYRRINRGIIIIIIIIIIILGISFMQDIYTYIPETNHVPREQCFATILVLLFMVLKSLVPALTPLYLYVSTLLDRDREGVGQRLIPTARRVQTCGLWEDKLKWVSFGIATPLKLLTLLDPVTTKPE